MEHPVLDPMAPTHNDSSMLLDSVVTSMGDPSACSQSATSNVMINEEFKSPVRDLVQVLDGEGGFKICRIQPVDSDFSVQCFDFWSRLESSEIESMKPFSRDGWIESVQVFEEHVSTMGYSIFKVNDDGNFLFRVIAMILFGDDRGH